MSIQVLIYLFWKKTKVEGNCIIWTGTVTHNGYGETKREGRKQRAHRWIHEVCLGPIPVGKLLMHSCDNRLCVKLQHLSIGDDKLNGLDMAAKGRGTAGDKNARAKLTWPQVEEIRHLGNSDLTQGEIGMLYGVTDATISLILAGKTWK